VGPRFVFYTVFHFLQIPQGDAHEAGIEHQLIFMGWPQVWGCRVHKEDPGVPSGHLVVTDEGDSKAANHHLVATVKQALLGHHVFALQVPPDSNLARVRVLHRVHVENLLHGAGEHHIRLLLPPLQRAFRARPVGAGQGARGHHQEQQ